MKWQIGILEHIQECKKKGHFKIFPKKQKTSQITAQVSTIMLVIKIFHSSFRKQGKTVIV